MRSLFLAFIALCVATGRAPAAPAYPVLAEAAYLVGFVMFRESGAPGLVLAVVRGDDALVQGYGETETGNGKAPDGDSLVRLNSITKVFATEVACLLATEGKAATTDDAMKKVYEDASKQITGEQEVHARHILVETEDEAKAIAAELKKGADFAELAKKKSKDPGASDGGDLGFFTKEQMVPEFSAVAFELEPGKISDPVKSQFGWHVIKVEEKRSRKAPDFEQVKGQIETYVTRKAQADYVAKLREAAKVERMDKPAEAAKSDAAKEAAKPADSKMAPPAKK